MNGEYIKAMDFDTYYETAKPYIDEAVKADVDKKKLAEWVKTRIETYPDIKDLIDFVDAVPEYSIEMYSHKKMKTDAASSLQVLTELKPILEAQDDYSNDALYALLVKFAEDKGYKNGYVLWPIRTALSGKQMTPAGATEIMELLGKDESLLRIANAIDKLKAGE
jgi:glutamyl-tRNA synthetase